VDPTRSAISKRDTSDASEQERTRRQSDKGDQSDKSNNNNKSEQRHHEPGAPPAIPVPVLTLSPESRAAVPNGNREIGERETRRSSEEQQAMTTNTRSSTTRRVIRPTGAVAAVAVDWAAIRRSRRPAALRK